MKSLEEKIEVLEKRVSELEGRVPAQTLVKFDITGIVTQEEVNTVSTIIADRLKKLEVNLDLIRQM